MNYIVRFAGTLTQGPNAGKTYTFTTSWGGKFFTSVADAKAYAASITIREPAIVIKIFSREFARGKFVEKEITT